MKFTLWPSARANEGGYGEIAWSDFLTFVANPVVAETKAALEGWSPVRFAGNRRAKAAVEAVSCIVLDDDASGLSTAAVCELFAGSAGVVHTSFSHTPAAPKHRVVLRCSRDMTVAEHEIVWRHVRDYAANEGQPIDEATKDASRLWYVPARSEGALYTWSELAGVELDVDAILNAGVAASTTRMEDTMTRPGTKAPAATAERNTDTGGTRRTAMAYALGAAWPAKGRHEAQLALAGALRSEGFAETEAVDFLCAVCRVAGDEDRSKREATCRHTWSREEGSALTGWTRLKSFVDPLVVDAARGALGRDAEWTAGVTRRLAEAAARAEAPVVASKSIRSVDAPVPADGSSTVSAGPITFRVGGLDAEQPPLVFQVEGLICAADVVMLVAHGGSLKTWLAFSLATSVANGRPWLGKFMTLRGRVAILDFESGEFEVTRRLKMLGAKDGDVADRLLRASYPGASLVDPETWVGMASLKLSLLVVDSFSAASPEADENDSRSAVMLQHAGKFAEATGCTVIFIHHARKGSGGDNREKVRGSSALFAACDRIFEFDQPESKDGGIVISTMFSMKDGAGRKPLPVRVELSDAGLRWLEAPVEAEKAPTADTNRALVVAALKQNTAGVPKKALVDLMQGKQEGKFALLSQLLISGITVEFSQKVGRSTKDYVMLRPGVIP